MSKLLAMKVRMFLFINILLLVFSCADDFTFSSEFEQSWDTWKTAKMNNGNSYSYTVDFNSFFGFGSTTTITVLNNIVVQRDYESYTVNGETFDKEIISIWSETLKDLGVHKEGAEPKTIEELYGLCENSILNVSEKNNFITFLTENNGIISTCSYFPKNCQDDCAIGFNISSIKWLK